MEELYYSHPVQVRYWDTQRQQYMGGIAYHEFLICGYDGEAKLITDVIAEAVINGKDQDNAIIELGWLSLNGEILGI